MNYHFVAPKFSLISREAYLNYHQQSSLRIQKSASETVLIPAAVSALIIDRLSWVKISQDSTEVFLALKNLSEQLISANEFDFLCGVSDVEKVLILKNPVVKNLVTVRFDGILSKNQWQAVELNTTIPAMQGYTDVANELFLLTESLPECEHISLYKSAVETFLTIHPVKSVLILAWV